MMSARTFLTEQGRKAVSKAVNEAEMTTSGEIVPAIATASGRYDRAEDIVGLFTAVISLAVAWLIFQDIRIPEGTWASGFALSLGLAPCLLIVFIGFVVGSWLAGIFPALRLPFILRREMVEEVERRAHEVFSRERVRGTAGGAGILIYVSLYEHMVRVLADDAVADKIEQNQWNEVRDLIIDSIKKNHPDDGLCQAVIKCGEFLAEHFPPDSNDIDELTNELRILD